MKRARRHLIGGETVALLQCRLVARSLALRGRNRAEG